MGFFQSTYWIFSRAEHSNRGAPGCPSSLNLIYDYNKSRTNLVYMGYCTFQKLLRQSGAGAPPQLGFVMRTRAQFGYVLYVFVRQGGDKKLSGLNAEKMRQSKFHCDCTRTGIKAAVKWIKILLKDMPFHFPFLEKRRSVLQLAVLFCCFHCSSLSKWCKSVSGLVWNKCKQANPAPDSINLEENRKYKTNLFLAESQGNIQISATTSPSSAAIQVKPTPRLEHGGNTQLYCKRKRKD